MKASAIERTLIWYRTEERSFECLVPSTMPDTLVLNNYVLNEYKSNFLVMSVKSRRGIATVCDHMSRFA